MFTDVDPGAFAEAMGVYGIKFFWCSRSDWNDRTESYHGHYYDSSYMNGYYREYASMCNHGEYISRI